MIRLINPLTGSATFVDDERVDEYEKIGYTRENPETELEQDPEPELKPEPVKESERKKTVRKR